MRNLTYQRKCAWQNAEKKKIRNRARNKVARKARRLNNKLERLRA